MYRDIVSKSRDNIALSRDFALLSREVITSCREFATMSRDYVAWSRACVMMYRDWMVKSRECTAQSRYIVVLYRERPAMSRDNAAMYSYKTSLFPHNATALTSSSFKSVQVRSFFEILNPASYVCPVRSREENTQNKEMASKAKALIGFARMKDDELMVAANTIVGAMTNNTHFPEPTPALEDMQVLVDDFGTKLAASRKRGSPEDTALKNESRVPLIEALQKLGYYVNATANGHLSTLLSSGFPTNSPNSPGLVPLAVQAVRIKDGRQSGQAQLDFERQRGVLMYEYRYRKIDGPDSAWSDRYSTSSSRGNVIAPLEVGEVYEFQVRALNTQGAGDWSNTVRLLVR